MNLEDISIKLVYDTLLDMDPEDISYYCQTSAKATQICSDDNFWRIKLSKDYGNEKQIEGITWKQQYQSKQIKVINSPFSAGDNYYGIIDGQGNLYIAGLDRVMGTIYHSKKPVRVLLESKVISVTIGNSSILSNPFMGIITEDGEAYMWDGDNITLTPPIRPRKLDFPRPGKIVKIDRDNTSRIYGIIMDNGLAYLIKPYSPEEPILVQADSGRKIVDFVIPIQNTWNAQAMCYFLDNYGDVYFFYMSINDKRKRIKLDFPDPIRKLSGSNDINLALSIKGDVYIWSHEKDVNYNLSETNQIPISEFIVDEKWAYLTPKKIYKINLPVPIESISVGFNNAAAITKNGTVYVWGSNTTNRLVDEIEEEKLIASGKIALRGYNRRVILRPLEIKLKSKIKSISLGSTFTIALTEDGVVNYWGFFIMAPDDTI